MGAGLNQPATISNASDYDHLRTKYHELLMEKMRQEGIEFSDRFDATHKAFQMLQQENPK